jgi:hypothetical protein
MTTPSSPPLATSPPIPPPSRHQLALMIWLAVFPTLTALNLALGDELESLSPVARTFVLATIAVPIVIYGLMPHLHRARARLLSRRNGRPVDRAVGRAYGRNDRRSAAGPEAPFPATREILARPPAPAPSASALDPQPHTSIRSEERE